MPSYSFNRIERVNFRKALATNSTATGFTARTPTATAPSSGIVNCEQLGGGIPNQMVITPYGTDANNEAFALRLLGWRKVEIDGSDLWIPCHLAEFTCTLGNIAATGLGTGNFLCDTVAKVGTIPHAEVYAATDQAGFATVSLLGFTRIEFQVDIDTAASGNALYSFI